ncbi:MAG TPA: VWA domain-containing protein, partial [Blastocatellia bacterium]|nr:VWA domain-containing protein [Blastocatellia bacterium]
YVTDLKMGDFEVYENGIKQEIALLRTVDEPFNVILLVDSSGSTSQQLDQIKSAAKEFIKQMRERDKVMVISFNDSVSVLCDFTGNVEVLDRAIDEIEAGEFTQVYEAVYTGIWEKFGQVEGRKAIILFSDGIDTASSEIQREDTLDALLESEDVIVYPLRYNTRPDVEKKLKLNGDYSTVRGDESSSEDGKRQKIIRELDLLYSGADDYLNELAELTGGRVERVDQLADLGMAFFRIAEELRNQYLIAYYPIKTKLARRVFEVKINRPGCQARVRPGFKVRTQ